MIDLLTTLKTDITVEDICKGFVYNEYEGKGLFGLSGKLVIQPEYQRNYIYADGKRDVAVIIQSSKVILSDLFTLQRLQKINMKCLTDNSALQALDDM